MLDIVAPEKYLITCIESLVMQISERLCLESKQLQRILNGWQLHRVTYKNLMLAQEYGTSVLWCNTCTVNLCVSKGAFANRFPVGGDDYRQAISLAHMFF